MDGFPGILTSGFRIGHAQAHKDKRCLKTKEIIGKGVYCTPGLGVAESYAKSRGGAAGTDYQGHKIIFIMQCRVNPAKIKHCHDYATNPGAYWVLNNPADIRPYRVLIKSVG